MSIPNFLFLIGNKRSGTTHLVELLNLHPSIFISHESDAIWILYQAMHGQSYRSYPWDGPVGMQATLESCHEILKEKSKITSDPGVIPDLFLRIQQNLMTQGSRVQKPYIKSNVQWVGDKKPVQQSDPEILKFIHVHFPTARFIHLIRHPKAVISSMVDAGKTWGQVGYWDKMSPDEILERWAIHEEWALDARSSYGDAVFSFRFEDLCANPTARMAEVYGFLGLQPDTQINTLINTQTRPVEWGKHEEFVLPESERADRIMEHYRYNR